MNKFEVGKTYRCTSPAAGKCHWYFKVTSRSADAIRAVGDDGKSYRLGVVTIDNVERCFPHKRLRVGLVLTASGVVRPEGQAARI